MSLECIRYIIYLCIWKFIRQFCKCLHNDKYQINTWKICKIFFVFQRRISDNESYKRNWTNHALIRDKNDQSHEELTTHIIYECNGKEVVIMMVMVEWGRRGHYNYSNGWFNSFFFCSFVQYETYIGVIPTSIWYQYYRFNIWNVVNRKIEYQSICVIMKFTKLMDSRRRTTNLIMCCMVSLWVLRAP